MHETVMETAEDEDKTDDELETAAKSDIETQVTAQRPESPAEEELYLLQPRTYTPVPLSPLPSPALRNRASHSTLQENRSSQQRSQHKQMQAPPQAPPAPPLIKKTSLRQRLSLKGNAPPEAIQVPARSERRLKHQVPRAPDSAYESSDFEQHRQKVISIDDSLGDLTPPEIPNTVATPHSEQHYFRPVKPNPHSPLQQRPWTSHASSAPPPRPHTSATHRAQHDGHLRNQPSAMGRSVMSSSPVQTDSGKTLKKKKSAFGWLKKAFSLDEEERAAFEARRQQQMQQQMHSPYMDDQSPRFLDGRRIR
jgi:hypothetical protein